VAESLFFFFLANVLLVVAIARYDSSSRLAPHPATAAKLPNLSLRGALIQNKDRQSLLTGCAR
ncbi:MAG: hypothetical protein V7606_1453, partial [Burkholderiales bacterium]